MPDSVYFRPASKQAMKITEVRDKRDWKQFHLVPRRIYAGDPNWICPIEADVQGVFDPAKNKAFENGDASVYVLFDEAGRPAGRIAAFVDHERNAKQAYPTGGIGFFECIDRAEYAVALFERAAAYLDGFDVKAIDGPVNFGERERYWGLLQQGYDPPLFQENYQPPYYRRFFEDWGFRPFEQILTFKGEIDAVAIDKFRRISQRVRQNNDISCAYFDKNRLDQMAADFSQVYNRSFSHFPHFKPLSQQDMRTIFKDFLPIADPKTVAIAYQGARPVGIIVMLPEINEFLRAAQGKLNFWTLPGFLLRLRYTRRRRSIKGILFGVDPDFQGRGLLTVLVDHLYNDYLKKQYEYYYLTTIRGHNEIMVNSIIKLNVYVDRVHVAYRKMLDASLPFEPFPFRQV